MRLRVIAENLANQHTTGPNGPYMRKDTILESVPARESFDSTLNGAIQSLRGDQPQSVEVTGVRQDSSEPIKVYDPHHPHADAQGYVSMPNISVFREMTDMVEASRMYEANLAASKASNEMMNQTIELLRG
jgi:flagellar basal-body rod protein FlgC